MISIVEVVEDDIPRILEIEQEAISPPWTYGSFLSEILRTDAYFVVAVSDKLQITNHKSQMTRAGIGERKLCGVAHEGLDKLQITNHKSQITGAGISERKLCDTVHAGLDILGFMLLRLIGDEGELLQIAVARDSRRCGIADILMEALQRYALDNALKSVFLEVRKSNEAAIALYKKHGYEPVGLRKNYYTSPVEDAVIMANEL